MTESKQPLSETDYLYQELTKRSDQPFRKGDLKALTRLEELDPEKAAAIKTFQEITVPKPPALPKKGCLPF